MTTYTPTQQPQIFAIDALKQPHLLIAGSVGSGKSVLLNSIMYAALMHGADKNQFIFIDLKRVELVDYADLPHTIGYIDMPQNVITALRYACDVMDERFKTMRQQHQKQSTEPHIYIVIDEYVDIKMRVNKLAETFLIRIASMGRAANMHIILCTQRPTRDIINGTIRANFTSAIGMRTNSKQESRNILDCNCCEQLPLYGYGYYKTPDYKTPQLIQINKINDDQQRKLIDFWLNK
ncbi:MAG: FtsK/SpoIIIE domain-containing protein [Faecalibacterium sp.]|nr:FtsK/SpoIIIE domain-containing protein [Ruminococcus sp.]MCM1391881.1 FtsK/SpoIIIE domain-containing protein [Ruminococcus sp.]MCM1485543.1 FtsK/SpoIIIE domain-containing protein [Faecalibacterium sp.]